MNNKKNILDENLKIEQSPITPEMRKSATDYMKAIAAAETNTIAIAHADRKKAWKFAIVSMVIALISVIALLIAMPLKEKELVVIKVDNTTGYTDVVYTLGESQSFSEAQNKFWLRTFVNMRESYDWMTISTNYKYLPLYANKGVANTYQSLLRDEKISPVERLGKNLRAEVEVKNFTFLESDVAQVRFSKVIKDNLGNKSLKFPETNWIATISFEYRQPSNLEGESSMNPFGFTVTSYRADLENG